MENATPATPISMEQRLEFWRTTIVRLGRSTPRAAKEEIKPLIAMIESGALGEDLVRQHGATLITYALAHWPSGEGSHWMDAYDDEKRKPAVLLDYKPGQEWDNAGAHAPLERVVASLLHVGADPWAVALNQKEGFFRLGDGQTFPPAWFALRSEDLPLASFHAFMDHPSCPPIEDLVRHRDEKGRSLVELAAARHPKALAIFLDRGADPNMTGSEDLPLLFRAATKESVRLLVRKGAATDLVDGKGNSLEVFWGLQHPVMGSSLISELPKRAKGSPPPKASLATLLSKLDETSRTNVRALLSSMKDPASHKWTVNGVEVDLLEALVSTAVFGPLRAKARELDEISNKKYGWSESSRKMLHLVRALCKAPDAGDKAADLGRSLDKKLGEKISDEEMAVVVRRAIEVHSALFPGARHLDLDNTDQGKIMFGWESLLRAATEDGKTTGSLALPMFQGMQHASLLLGRVGAYFTDKMFRCIAPFVDQNPLSDRDWKFWTSMGIASAGLADEKLYALWLGTLPDHDPDWFEDASIKMQLARPGQSELRAKLEEIILQRRSEEPSSAPRIAPRL